MVCGRVDIPPEGYQLASKKAKDGRNIFQPERNYVAPRTDRLLPSWQRTGQHDANGYEMEIIFPYGPSLRVVRKQWSDRRLAYTTKRQPKPKTKLVIPQFHDGQSWQWGKGGQEWPLYRADDVRRSDVLFYVGGETCVEALRKLGFSAVCQQGGEGNYLDQVVQNLRGMEFRSLIILPDNDRAGRRQAKKLSRLCSDAGIPTAVLEPYELADSLPPKWDIADWDIDPQEARAALVQAVKELEPVWNENAKTGDALADLQNAVTRYAETEGDFERFLLEQQLQKDHGIRGQWLTRLETVVKPVEHHTHHVSEDAELWQSDFEGRLRGEVQEGARTGFIDFDDLTGGFVRTDLMIAAGRPSMGKSAWAGCAVLNVAKEGHPVALFTLEMSKQQFYRRLIAVESGIDSALIRAPKFLSNQDIERVRSAAMTVFGLPIFIDESKAITPAYVRENCLRIQDENDCELGLVAIDYAQLMQPSKGSAGNLYQDQSRVFSECKDIMGARELNCPGLLLSQLSRGVESRTNKRPMMSDLRETGKAEEVADIIAMFYREDYYDPDTPDRGIAEVIVPKNRNGSTGTVKLLFEPQYTRFRNLGSY